MKTFTDRRAFTVVELAVVIVVLVAALALLLPSLSAQQEQSKEMQCANNMKQLALGLLNFEDKRRCLPPISTNVDSVPDVPGDATPGLQARPGDDAKVASGIPTIQGQAPNAAAGYSWQVFILPEIDQAELYQMIVARSKKFQMPAFASEIIEGFPRKTTMHAATVGVRDFKCPSFSGDSVLDNSPRITGSATNVESGTLPANYQGGIATANGAKGMAITNYNAILGTHIDPDKKSASMPNNGGMMFRGTAFDQGRKLGSMNDGTSKIPLVAETRERRFASWYDGTMNWIVATRHSAPSAPATAITPATSVPNSRDPHLPPSWKIGTDGTTNTGGSALNYGPTEKTPTAVCLPTAALSDPDISMAPPGRLWGPSSQHPGGVVFHAFCDGHVTGIYDSIDPNLYLAVVTRNGGESTP